MTLNNILNDLKNFDAKKDKVNDASNGLPAGTYNTAVAGVQHFASNKSGYEAICVIFKALDGKYIGTKEFTYISLAETTLTGKMIPDFVIERNIKFLMKLDALTHDEPKLTINDFMSDNLTDKYETIVNKLRDIAGKTIELTVITRENSKDKTRPFKNYDLEMADPLPKKETKENKDVEINDFDLPF